MRARRHALLGLLVTALSLVSSRSRADDEPSTPQAEGAETETEAAARSTTSPFPTSSELTFKPAYTFPHGDNRYRAEIVVEPRFRYQGFILPDVHVDGFASVARFELPAISLENRKGVAGGLGDLSFADVVVYAIEPLELAVGFASVFPMATSPELGKGKWQFGPAAGLRLDTVSWLKVAGLTQTLWSVAGSSQSPTLAYETVQPFISVHFPHALFLSSDATMSFCWAGCHSTVPVNLGFGDAISKHFVASVVGEYTAAMANEGDVKVIVKLKYLP